MRVYLLLVAIIAVLAVAAVSVQSPAVADDPDRTIPTITVSSPSAGEINVVWGTPSETGTLTSYRVSWAPWSENGFTSYKDANSDTGGNAYPTAPASSYTITGLAHGEYAVYVRARYEDSQNGPFRKSAKVVVGSAQQDDEEPTPTPEPTETPTPEPTLAPGAITGLTLTSSRPGHLWVSWDEASPGPTEYRLNWAEVDDPFPSWNSNQGGNLWLSAKAAQDFSNLVEAGVTYKLWMRAIYKTGPNAPWSGPWSEVVTQRVRNHPPGAPTGLSVDSATHDGVVLAWSAPEHNGLTGYRIQRGSDADSLETIVEDTGDLATGYTDTTAADDATHHYAIIALSLDGDGRRSGTVSATTPPRTPETPVIVGAPAAPAGLSAQLDGSGGVTLNWTDPDDDGITGYRILRGDDAVSMRIIVENTGSATVGYTDATAPVNSTHVYAVQAHNSVGLSQLSNSVSVTTLSAPTELETSAASGRVVLSWSAPEYTGLTGYRILRGSSADALETIVNDTGNLALSYTDTTVSEDATYYYAVMALSLDGDSPQSGTVSATTPPAADNSPPRGGSKEPRKDDEDDVTPRQTVTVDPPVLSEAMVDDVTMTLTYDSDLDTTSVPATSAYTVTVTYPVVIAGSTIAVSGVDIADDKVTLTLKGHVPAEATVTITYTVPSDNPVQTEAVDGATNMKVSAAALDNHSVENRTGILITNSNRPRTYGHSVFGVVPVAGFGRASTNAYFPGTDLLNQRSKLAQQFTTGAKTGGYQLGIVRLALYVKGDHVFQYDGTKYDDPDHPHWGTDLNIPRVSIWSDSSGNPGAELQELVVARSLSASDTRNTDFYANDLTLQPGTKYWFVVETRAYHYWLPRGFIIGGGNILLESYTPGSRRESDSFVGWKIDHTGERYLDGSWYDKWYGKVTGVTVGIHESTMNILFTMFSESPVSQPFFRNADGNGEADRVRLHYVNKVYSDTDDLSLGTLPVNNFDDDTLTFEVISGDTAAFNNKFTLDTTTGEISLKENARESRVGDTTYQIRVTVTDGEDQFGLEESSPTVDDTADVYVIASQ